MFVHNSLSSLYKIDILVWTKGARSIQRPPSKTSVIEYCMQR